MTVNVFYPDADTESTSVDGNMQRTQPNDETSSWSDMQSGAGTQADDSAPVITLEMFTHSTAGRWSYLTRAILLFNTSDLSGLTLTSATIGVVLYAGGVTDDFSQTCELVLSTPASNTALVAADYTELGTALQATGKALSSYTAGPGAGYQDITLSATGLGNISKTSITKLGFRFSGDVSNTEPTSPGGSERSRLQIYSAEETHGSDIRPKLTVITVAPFTPKAIMF